MVYIVQLKPQTAIFQHFCYYCSKLNAIYTIGKRSIHILTFSGIFVSACATDGSEYTCLSGNCIPIEKVCDGVIDCPDGEDERNC